MGRCRGMRDRAALPAQVQTAARFPPQRAVRDSSRELATVLCPGPRLPASSCSPGPVPASLYHTPGRDRRYLEALRE